jgi:hypothetical protein
MFEFRLRILEVGPGQYAGVVDGLPDFLVTGTSIPQTERDLVAVFVGQLQQLLHYDRQRFWLDDFPAVRIVKVYVAPGLG